jgi:hypothetical protein
MQVAAKLGALAVVVTFATSTRQPAMAARAASVCDAALKYCNNGRWQGQYDSFLECVAEQREIRCPPGASQFAPDKAQSALWIDPKTIAA